MDLRALVDAAMLGFRGRLAEAAGKTFGGRRDLFKVLGYKRSLLPTDYRSRYRRNEVANRIVKARPLATWRGAAVIEDEDPTVVTPFEQAFLDFDTRLKFWDKMRRADILSGIGRYAIILIGAPGELDQPLVSVSGPEDIAYLQPYAEEDATIELYEADKASPRFGLPVRYSVKRTGLTSPDARNSAMVGRSVHWTRVLHISDGLLDDNIFGEPRLECVWNRLDDLEKIAGGGAEAFWRRADAGRVFDIDPDMELDPEAEKAFKKQVVEYEHDLRRNLLTRGLKVESLGSDVADFKNQVEALMSLISVGCGIPQRVLMGSEQGKLAAKQDRANWDNQITDRQNDYADACCTRPAIARFIELGALPAPKADLYDVRFSSLTTMDDEQRAGMAKEWASLNTTAGDMVVTVDEIRERCLDLPPLDDVLPPEDIAASPTSLNGAQVASLLQIVTQVAAGYLPRESGVAMISVAFNVDAAVAEQLMASAGNGFVLPTAEVNAPPVAEQMLAVAKMAQRILRKGGSANWKHVHQAADRFRPAVGAKHLTLLQRGSEGNRWRKVAQGVGGKGRGRSIRAGK